MLYANGCSFTYGTGLAHKDKAWPFILAEKLGIKDVETDAQRGVSNNYIVRNTITNLSDKIANGEKIDFVGIGMTAPNRREHFIEKKNLLIHNIPSHEYHGNIQLDDATNKELNSFNSLYMKNFWSPVYDFHCYLIHLITLQNFFKAHDIPYIIFNSLNLTPNLLEDSTFTELCEQSDMVNVYKLLDMKRIYEETTFFTYMYGKEMYYPIEGDERYMHPNEKAHSEWADIIYKAIEK